MSAPIVCKQCNVHFAVDALGICVECQRTNALAFEGCDTCDAEAVFRSDGRVAIRHEPGCRAHAEFMRQVDDIDEQ
jgi:hypothetical protein